jgi:hypothetical protein
VGPLSNAGGSRGAAADNYARPDSLIFYFANLKNCFSAPICTMIEMFSEFVTPVLLPPAICSYFREPAPNAQRV